ncbi:MAG: methionyl-tRNA formyltransferase [Clostridia bacterium]|nr:methionyl-tRNA formyltransferase [Clostridia bacterium]
MAARIVFMGTPEFAVPSLKALVKAGFDVVGVFTQPDRPVGRGHKLQACPVKQCALENGLEVFQFEKVKTPEGVAQMKALAPDVVVTAAFGQILTRELLDIPVHGTVNVHASLLPGYRGSAPINWCILNGEKEAGVTIMLTDIGIDTGDMLKSAKTEIGELETAGELTVRLSELGAELLVPTLEGYLSGEIKPVKQDESLASYQPMLDKAMGEIDWTMPAEQIACRIRGLNPWPCAYTDMEGGRLKIYLAKPVESDCEAAPGTVIVSGAKEGLVVKCGKDALEILEMQAPNGKRMAPKAYLMGKKIETGTRFGKDTEA